MTCPNCSATNDENAHFCLNCGFRFDEIRQTEPIRINISPPAAPPLAAVAPPVAPTVIVREKKSGATAAIVALTILVTLLIVGAAGLLAYYLLTRPERRTETVQSNANLSSVNSVAAASPQPTTYEDLKNKLAPPDKRTGLMDESFAIEPNDRRAVEFEISEPKAKRVLGGLRVVKGAAIDFVIARADIDGESPPSDTKPLLEQSSTRNKIVNHKLDSGYYYLIFINNSDLPATVAAEFFVVSD